MSESDPRVLDRLEEFESLEEPEDPQKRAVYEDQRDPKYHLREGHLFGPDGKPRHGKMLVVGENDDPYAIANARQQGRRAGVLSDMVQNALIDRVKDPTGPDVMKVTWKEFERMRHDPNFKSFAQYMNTLMYYTDRHGFVDFDKPRARPVRPLLQNEVGMYYHKIVVLADAGPDDIGEGKYFTVLADLRDPKNPRSIVQVEKEDTVLGAKMVEQVDITENLEPINDDNQTIGD